MAKSVGVIMCAAGASTRFGGGKKKPFIDVAGRAAFLHSIELFTDLKEVKQVILAISPEDEESVKVKWGPNLQFFGVKLCFGGAERFDTVAKALKEVRDDIRLVAVHDAVRCCLTKEWVQKVFAEAEKTGAAILAAPVVPTIKRVKDKAIVETVHRSDLYEAQTPQVFETGLLREAYAKLEKLDKSKVSDDAQLVEALGRKVSIVETDTSNIKITRNIDIAIAEAIIKARPKPKGEGYIGPYGEAQW
jgi:2-C-methyl-D-erythritol 4-phosphate cytidylyltransferase